MIVFRVLHYRTFFDNFSLCVAYTANVGAITSQQLNWYFDANIMVWTYFILAVLFNSIYMRVTRRIWEHMRALLVLNEKTFKQQLTSTAAISAHIAPDILEYLFPDKYSSKSKGNSNSESSSSNKYAFLKASENQRSEFDYKKSRNSEKKESLLLREAVNLGIISNFEEGVVTVDDLKTVDGVDKRSTALIGVKVDSAAAKDCALAIDRESKIHKILDFHAKRYGITSVRRFGNVW